VCASSEPWSLLRPFPRDSVSRRLTHGQVKRPAATGWEAVRRGDWGVALRLLDERDEGADPKDLESALFWAAGHGRGAIVELLLARGADINSQYSGGWTPLMHASEQGKKTVVELLLRRGADTTIQNYGNNTAERKAATLEIRQLIQVGEINLADGILLPISHL
jgi:hypothetical protein